MKESAVCALSGVAPRDAPALPLTQK